MNPGVYPVPPGYPTKSLGGRQVLAYCPTSRVVKAPFNGLLRVRAMGAASSGANGSTANGANGATVTLTSVRVRKNDPITVTIGAGGARQATNNAGGANGGTTTIVGPNGLNVSIPPSTPGLLGGAQTPNPLPTGVDEYWLGGFGGTGSGGFGGGGGSPALLEGVQTPFDGGKGLTQPGGGAGVGGNGSDGGGSGGSGGGSGGPAVVTTPGPNLAGQNSSSTALTNDTHCRLLVNVSGGGGSPGGPGGGSNGQNVAGIVPIGGFGGGGGGNGSQSGANAGGGGKGGGGGGVGSAASSQSGFGGDAFVTLEFQEEV